MRKRRLLNGKWIAVYDEQDGKRIWSVAEKILQHGELCSATLDRGHVARGSWPGGPCAGLLQLQHPVADLPRRGAGQPDRGKLTPICVRRSPVAVHGRDGPTYWTKPMTRISSFAGGPASRERRVFAFGASRSSNLGHSRKPGQKSRVLDVGSHPR